jgi:hypothetical protein
MDAAGGRHRAMLGVVAGRVSYGLRGRRGPERDQLVFETVLHLHARDYRIPPLE